MVLIAYYWTVNEVFWAIDFTWCDGDRKRGGSESTLIGNCIKLDPNKRIVSSKYIAKARFWANIDYAQSCEWQQQLTLGVDRIS